MPFLKDPAWRPTCNGRRQIQDPSCPSNRSVHRGRRKHLNHTKLLEAVDILEDERVDVEQHKQWREVLHVRDRR